jgi:hypothetical protein
VSTSNVTPVQVLTTIARTLVHTERYATVDEALRGLALKEVERKVLRYRRRVRYFERKHGTDFDGFSASLESRATPAEEDDWLAWRAALSLLADWEKAHDELKRNAVAGS